MMTFVIRNGLTALRSGGEASYLSYLATLARRSWQLPDGLVAKVGAFKGRLYKYVVWVAPPAPGIAATWQLLSPTYPLSHPSQPSQPSQHPNAPNTNNQPPPLGPAFRPLLGPLGSYPWGCFQHLRWQLPGSCRAVCEGLSGRAGKRGGRAGECQA